MEIADKYTKNLLCFLFLGIYTSFTFIVLKKVFSSKVYTNAPRCSIL